VTVIYTDEAFDQISISVIPEDAPISLQVHHSQDVNCPKDVAKASSSDEAVVSLFPITKAAPKVITLLGEKVGKTTVDVVYTDNEFDQLAVIVTASAS
jgi:hypothetical protein